MDCRSGMSRLQAWHVSIARVSRGMDRILPVETWPPNVLRQARELQRKVLQGVGCRWELEEMGESALHLRRRLSPKEMGLLHMVNSACPVFTHGAALKEMEAADV